MMRCGISFIIGLSAWIGIGVSAVAQEVEDPRVAIELAAETQGPAALRTHLDQPSNGEWKGGRFYTAEELQLKLLGSANSPAPAEIDGAPRGGPANDLCADAILVAEGSHPFSTVGATSSPGLSDTYCNFGFVDGGSVQADIWFLYQAPYTGRVTISLCGANYDTKMAIYARLECPTSPEQAIACDDDYCGSAQASRVAFDMTVGEYYHIRIGGYNGAQGSGTMVITSGEAPENDLCINAIELPCDDTITFDNSFATTSAEDPIFPCFYNGGKQAYGTVWFKFVAPHGSIQIRTCNSAGAQNTLVALYDGENGCPTVVDELGCGEDECGPQASICIGSLVPERTYYIQVASCEEPSYAHSPAFCDITSNPSRGSVTLELICPCPVGPDVIVGGLFGTGGSPTHPDWNKMRLWGRNASLGISAYSVGTISCNPGDVEVQWNATNNKHPVIGQQLYRLKDGRFEQIGMSWVKHGFLALTENFCNLGCIPPDPFTGETLGVGCSDPYNYDLNGTTSRLGPRGHINAFTGSFPYPFTTAVQFPPPGAQATIGRRLQVKDADLIPAQNVGAKYFIEGHYITSDDATHSNGLNNASSREVTVANPSGFVFNLTMTGPDYRTIPSISLWKLQDPEVVETMIDVPNEGRFILAAKATDLGGGIWNYEYALYNYNSDRSGQSVTVQVPEGIAVTNVGFHDVDHHSGDGLGTISGTIQSTDWTSTVGMNYVRWETTTFATSQLSNALRWANLYNYRFDAAAPPTTGTLTIGLFKPGVPTEISGLTLVPQAPAAPSCDCLGDVDANNELDARDIEVFVAMYLEQTPASDCANTAMPLDEALDDADVQEFVNYLLEGVCVPLP